MLQWLIIMFQKADVWHISICLARHIDMWDITFFIIIIQTSWQQQLLRVVVNDGVFIYFKSLVVAGIASGATEGFVLTPFERVKVYMMQAQRTQLSQVNWLFRRMLIN